MTGPRNLFAVAALSLMVSGCALLGRGTPPLDTYELSAPNAQNARESRGRTQILIAQPTALKSLDGQNIVISPKAGVVQYLKGAQWADRLPEVVQVRLAETFQRSGRFGGVGLPGEGLAIDHQIITEIKSFEVRVDRGQGAHVEIFVRILNDRTGAVRASRSFEATAPVAGTGNDAYVAGLDNAFGQVASEIVQWTDTLI